MLIRACVPADVEPLEKHLPTGHNRAHARHLARQQAGTITYLVAFHEGTPAGACAVAWEGLRDADARAAYPGCPEISSLHVAATLRGHGIGTALVRAAEEHARSRGHTRIGLGVGDENLGAARLYARLGYADTGIRWLSRRTYLDAAGAEQQTTERNLVLVRNLS